MIRDSEICGTPLSISTYISYEFQKERKRQKNIWSHNGPKLRNLKKNNLRNLEALQTLSRINLKRSIPSYLINCWKIKTILITARDKHLITCKGSLVRLTVDISSEIRGHKAVEWHMQSAERLLTKNSVSREVILQNWRKR